jgi:hypothetical protein
VVRPGCGRLSAEGIYLNLTSLRSYGAQHLELDHRKTGATLYLHLRYTKVRRHSCKVRVAVGGSYG